MQGHAADFDVGIGPDAASADERGDQGVAGRRRLHGHAAGHGLGGAACSPRAGAAAPDNKGGHALNNSLGTADPTAFIGAAWSKLTPPLGINWGWFKDDETDALCAAIAVAFEPEEQTVADGEVACSHRRSGTVVLRGARPQSACAVAESEGLRAGAKLATGSDAGGTG